jgi:hypothetical protein
MNRNNSRWLAGGATTAAYELDLLNAAMGLPVPRAGAGSRHTVVPRHSCGNIETCGSTTMTSGHAQQAYTRSWSPNRAAHFELSDSSIGPD